MYRRSARISLCLFVLGLLCQFSSAAEPPIVDMLTATTGKNITASVIEEVPTARKFEGINLPSFPQPDALITATTQKDKNTLFLFEMDSSLEIFRSKIELEAIDEVVVGPFQKFGLKASEFYPALQASQFSEPHAIALFHKDQYRAVRFNKNGLNAHRFSQIYPIFPDETFSFSGGASSDFRFSWNSGQINNAAGFYGIARLTPKLKVDGNPLGVTGPVVISGDITNDLNGNGRIFFYREIGTKKGDRFTTRITAQRFDPARLTFIGDPYPITKFVLTPFVDAESIQSVAVDPTARFVAYTTFSKSCNKEILKYRLLDNNFRPTGKSRTILGCNDLKNTNVGAFGLDIIRLSF